LATGAIEVTDYSHVTYVNALTRTVYMVQTTPHKTMEKATGRPVTESRTRLYQSYRST